MNILYKIRKFIMLIDEKSKDSDNEKINLVKGLRKMRRRMILQKVAVSKVVS